MDKIVGVVPAAGDATRIGGFEKGLTPIKPTAKDDDFIVVSELILKNLIESGAKEIKVIINSERDKLREYITNRSRTLSKDLTKIGFHYQSNTEKYYGMPFAINAIPLNDDNTLYVLGMPDTVIEPNDSFKILIDNFHRHDADLELGLFKTKEDMQGGYIKFNKSDNLVIWHMDKVNTSFPWHKADNTWAIACWNNKFMQFMHNYIEINRDKYMTPRFEPYGRNELLFGDIIDATIKPGSRLRVCSDFIDAANGFYFDISNIDRYCEALIRFHGDQRSPTNMIEGDTNNVETQKQVIFISYSSDKINYALELRELLRKYNYELIIDKYDVYGGDHIDTRLQRLISSSHFVVMLINDKALDSHWIEFEKAVAFTKKKTIIPVEIEPVNPEKAYKTPIISKGVLEWIIGTKGPVSVAKEIDRIIKNTKGARK